MIRIVLVLLAVSTLLLQGCSWVPFPGVHKVPIQQGNYITQEMVDQLEPGMTREQVRYVMGTPLVADTFNQDRWDYIYSVKLPNGNTVKKKLTVYFQNDVLSRTEGDYRPGGGATKDQAVLEAEQAIEEAKPDVTEMAPEQ